MGYKQKVKEKARQKIWVHAVESLTKNREETKILNPEYIQKLWDYSFNEWLIPYNFVRNIDNKVLEDWLQYSESIYKQKVVEELKIAYLCGQEPENDLEILLEMGVKIENIWAVERDDYIYKAALDVAKEKFTNLKIFHGEIDDLIKIYQIPFDIIYLDFTVPIFSVSKKQKPLKSIHNIFEEQALSELGVLITNFAEPECDILTADFLASYFLNQEYVEGEVIGIKNYNDTMSYFSNSSDFMEKEELVDIIMNDMDSIYSAFCTHYIISYANIISPAYRTMLNSSVKKQLFKENKDSLWRITEMMRGNIDNDSLYTGELMLNRRNYPYWNFINSISAKKSKLHNYWFEYFNSAPTGNSRFDAIRYRDLTRNYYLGMDLASDKLKNAIPEIHSLVKEIENVFCDYPSPFLWLELAMNQLGSPYHSQLHKHMRFRYKAKKTEMFVDSFVFDKCRSLYDWLPMIDLYGEELSKIEKQILVRICLDIIGGKQSGHIIPSLYFGSNLIGQGEKDWVHFVFGLPKRMELN